jgi:alkanesulfonate monooxygenase SsuD/methylene tetrahydromethanopterin reductase-like flavin-dependent oxidoreductase (luciferase family)
VKISVLLPHFGNTASYERTIEFSTKLEGMGFSGVFVRDQIGFEGHDWEGDASFFLDPFVTLTTIAALTKNLVLGTATLIPFRHPAVLAQLMGSLCYVAPGRVIMGWGVGTPKLSFAVTGIKYEDRIALGKESIQVLRAVSRPQASFHGTFVNFDDFTLDPAPPADLEVWYGGSTNASVDRALDYCTGWFPGRCPMPTFDEKLARLRRGEEAAGKRMKVGIIPIMSIDRDREAALRKVNVEGLLGEARHRTGWVKAGPFNTAEDLRGLLIAGTPTDVIEELKQFERRGVDQLVLDFRLRMDAYEESLQQISEEVLPAFPGCGAEPGGAKR